MWASVGLANIAALILRAAITWTGVTLLNRLRFWLGVFFAAMELSIWLFEVTSDLQVWAVVLVCAGIGLVTVGMQFESYLKKRRLV